MKNPNAFPSTEEEWYEEKRIGGIHHPGMPLRDYFAGQALTGALANQEGLDKIHAEFHNPYSGSTQNLAEYFAEKMYIIADAMLKERNKK